MPVFVVVVTVSVVFVVVVVVVVVTPFTVLVLIIVVLEDVAAAKTELPAKNITNVPAIVLFVILFIESPTEPFLILI